MARIPRFLRTQAGLRVALGLAAAVVWGVTWASTLPGGPVAVASSAARTTPSPSPTGTPIVALASTPLPSPSPKPTRDPRPSPSPTPARTPTSTPTATSTPPPPTPTPTQATAATCTVAYRVSSSWAGGFVAAVGIGNSGPTTWSSWTLAFTFPGDQRITGAWNGIVTQSGASVTVTSTSSDGTVRPGGSAGFGFQATYSGRNVNPTSFTLNGRACTTI